SDRQALQVELEAARQDGHRKLLGICRCKQKLHMRRRLLQRFQKRIERVRGKHVYLVHEIHLVSAARRAVLNVVQELTRVIDLRARRGIDLDQVDETPGIDL